MEDISAYTALKTLTGLSVLEVLKKLDEELPPDAYSQVPGGANLTDIDPGWMRKVLTEVFGLCGVGWGYLYSPEHLHLTYLEKAISADLSMLTFWYVLLDEHGKSNRLEILSSGGSENRSAAYAMKGAITNAIGHAASNIGFQESVYLGRRTHATVREKRSSKNGSGGTNGSAPAPSHPAEFVLMAGLGIGAKHIGKRVSELSEAALAYYANLDGSTAFKPHDEAGRTLQDCARLVLGKVASQA